MVSDELKDAKKNDDREQQKQEREELAAEKKRTKMIEAAESDGMKSDCFDSDDSDNKCLAGSMIDVSVRSSPRCRRRNVRDELSGLRQSNCGTSVGSSMSPSISSSRTSDGNQSLSNAGSRHGKRIPSAPFPIDGSRKAENPEKISGKICANVLSPAVKTGHKGCESSPVDSSFDDGYESSPKQADVRQETKRRMQIVNLPSIRYNDGFQSDGSRPTAERQSESRAPNYNDDMSSSSEWSSQYGEVVAGHLFR